MSRPRLFVEDEEGNWEYERRPHPWDRGLGPQWPNGKLIPVERWRYPIFEAATNWCPICNDDLDEDGLCLTHDYAVARDFHKAHEPYWWETVTLGDGQHIRVTCGGGYLE